MNVPKSLSIVVGAFFILLIGMSAHSAFAENPYKIEKCILPAALQGVYKTAEDGFRPIFPISVYVDPAFPDGWKAQAFDAMEEWNKFSRESLQKTIFEVRTNDALPEYAVKHDVKFNIEQRKASDSKLVITRANWKYNVGFTEAAVKKFYPPGKYGIATRGTEQQIVSVGGPDETKITASDSPFIKGIVLHELGHAVGLTHTCDAEYVHQNQWACNSLPNQYRDRVMGSIMYPRTFDQIASGDIQNKLTLLDSMRIFCLYKH